MNRSSQICKAYTKRRPFHATGKNSTGFRRSLRAAKQVHQQIKARQAAFKTRRPKVMAPPYPVWKPKDLLYVTEVRFGDVKSSDSQLLDHLAEKIMADITGGSNDRGVIMCGTRCDVSVGNSSSTKYTKVVVTVTSQRPVKYEDLVSLGDMKRVVEVSAMARADKCSIYAQVFGDDELRTTVSELKVPLVKTYKGPMFDIQKARDSYERRKREFEAANPGREYYLNYWFASSMEYHHSDAALKSMKAIITPKRIHVAYIQLPHLSQKDQYERRVYLGHRWFDSE